jgi:2-methylcitrate dehydratase PrpD
MNSDASPLAARLGALIANGAPTISPVARERAKVSILHNLAMALAGRRIETLAHRIAATTSPLPAQAMLLATGQRVSAEAAAFANAALIHARSQDDTHAPSTSHPGAPTLAAAIAIGESTGASGGDLLDAVVLGYEVLSTIGSDIDEQLTARGYRAAPVLGIFGAAAAAAHLLRLSPEASGHALGLATHMAGGLAQVWQEGSAEGPLQLGFAARNGVFAARAAAAGATAAVAAIEGPRGLFAALAGSRPEIAIRHESDRWQIEDATIKAFPACAILQGPLERLLAWMNSGADATQVTRADLHLSPYEAGYPGIDNPGPFASPTATKLSAQFCLGAMLAHGRLSRTDLESTSDPLILAKAAGVRVVIDADLVPRQCRIDLHGPKESLSIAQMTPVGQPGLADAIGLAQAMGPEADIPAAAMAEWTAVVADLDRQQDLAGLLDALVRTCRTPA